ncbi:MAG: hypothetical protein NTU53_06625 [Planctomycetota bacterium]|nr:hypothetical protein [Planctomycetota bacterium]
MNQLPRVVHAVGLVCIFVVSSALAQMIAPAPPAALRKATLPFPIKSADSLKPEEIALINSAVAENFAALLDPSPAVQQSAREAIINDSRAVGDPSAAFSNAYAQAVVSNITARAIANAKPIRVRLNAAVALARVAEAIQNPKLEPAVLMFLADNQPYGLRLWGVKAAKGILPELAKANAAQKLLAAVMNTVKKYPTGAMTADAYEALQVRDAAMINAMLEVIYYRVALYKKGLPEDPHAEAGPFGFFTKLNVWNALNPAQRVKVMQAFCDVLVLAAYHGDAQPQGPGPRELLLQVVKGVCQSLQVAAQPDLIGDKDLEAAAVTAIRVIGTSGANLSQAIKDIPPVIRKIKGYEAVAEPKLVPPPSTNPIVVSN